MDQRSHWIHNMIKYVEAKWASRHYFKPFRKQSFKIIVCATCKLTCLERVELDIQKLLLGLYQTPRLPLLHQKKISGLMK